MGARAKTAAASGETPTTVTKRRMSSGHSAQGQMFLVHLLITLYFSN